MNIKQRLKLRRQLNISASELELIELVNVCALSPLSLSQLGEELTLSKAGVDKMAIRLVDEKILFKINGKLFITDRVLNVLHPVEENPTPQPIQKEIAASVVEPAPTLESVMIPLESGKVCITIEITYKAQR